MISATAAIAPKSDSPQGYHAERGRCKKRLPFAPGGQSFQMHPGPSVFSEHRQVFTQIQVRREFRDRLLACADGIRRRGRLEPCCQRLLAHAGASSRQQFEQRCTAEDVQVLGVEVVLVEESRAGLARSRPVPVQPRQRPLIEGHRTREGGALGLHLL